jgi:hypothetical protein
MVAAARFYDARLKSSRASASVLASTFAPSLARRHCHAYVMGPTASSRGLEVVRQLGGAPTARRFSHGAALAPGPSVQAASRGAPGPVPAPGEGWPALRRAGTLPSQVPRVAPVVGPRWRGDAAPILGRSYSRPKPRGCCIRAYGCAAAWSLSSGLSQGWRQHRSCAGC